MDQNTLLSVNPDTVEYLHDKSVLMSTDCMIHGVFEFETRPDRQLIGAVFRPDNEQIITVLQALKQVVKNCPYTQNYVARKKFVPGYNLEFLPVRAYPGWELIYVDHNRPEWVTRLFVEYLDYFKKITNSDRYFFLKIYTKEMLDTYLDGGTILDHFADLAFCMVTKDLFTNAWNKFMNSPLGWQVDTDKIPVFMSIQSINDQQIVLMPAGLMGSTMVPTMLTIPMEEFPRYVLSDQISLYASGTNEHIRELVQEFHDSQLKEKK